MRKLLVIGIGLLFFLTTGCGGGKTEKYSDTSPEGVVQAYYDALLDGKPDVAYGFLKAPWPKSKDEFVAEKKTGGMSFKEYTVGTAQMAGNKATVPVVFKTGISSMPEVTMNLGLELGKAWEIADFGMGSVAGHVYDDSSGGQAVDTGSGGMGGAVPGSPNPHGPGGSVPLDDKKE